MADLKVIDGDGRGKEDRDRQHECEAAESGVSWAIRDAAANILRIIRGAGKPNELLLQMKSVVDSAVEFQELHGYWPYDVIANDLRLRTDENKPQADAHTGRVTQADIDRWWVDGERRGSEHIIQRGVLQIIASDLIGQPGQKGAGESELHDGIHSWVRSCEKLRQGREETSTASRASAAGLKKPRNRRRPPKL